MAKTGDEFANHDGGRLVYRKTAGETNGELLEVEVTYTPHSTPPVEHYHPFQEERFEVLSGTMRVIVNGSEQDYGAGEVFTVLAGTPHWMHNAGDEPGRVVWQTRPAMRTEIFFETVWGLEQDGKVNHAGGLGLLQLVVIGKEFSDHFRLTRPPFFIQQVLFFVLSPIGKWSGYKAVYPEYSQVW